MKRNGKANGNGHAKPARPQVGSLAAEHARIKTRLVVLANLMEDMSHEDMGWFTLPDASQFHAATAIVSELRKRMT